MSPTYPDQLAERLVEARRRGNRIPEPHSERYMEVAAAYDAQAAFVARWTETGGSQVVGYKLSAISDGAQRSLGVSEPLLGTLFAEDVLESPALLPLTKPGSALIEVELVFVLGADLPEHCSRDCVMSSASIAAGIELPDSRYESWPEGAGSCSAQDFVSDNAFSGRLVVGASVPLEQLDVTKVPIRLLHDGRLVAEGNSECILGDPVRAVTWLARSLPQVGGRLSAGMVVASGAIIGPLPATDGTYRAELESVGSVSIKVGSTYFDRSTIEEEIA